MKTREKGYSDYGFEQGEEERLKHYCKNAGFTDQKLLFDAAIAANPALAVDLFYSVLAGVGYDSIIKIKYIPIPKQDFYGYQRKCLAIFRNFLLLFGKWK